MTDGECIQFPKKIKNRRLGFPTRWKTVARIYHIKTFVAQYIMH